MTLHQGRLRFKLVGERGGEGWQTGKEKQKAWDELTLHQGRLRFKLVGERGGGGVVGKQAKRNQKPGMN